MTKVYTTQRCLIVEEDYQTMLNALVFPGKDLFQELTEVITSNRNFSNFEVHSRKRKVLIKKESIVEIINSEDCEWV